MKAKEKEVESDEENRTQVDTVEKKIKKKKVKTKEVKEESDEEN